jgi:hypothetical protein
VVYLDSVLTLVQIYILISQLLYGSIRADYGQKSSSEVQSNLLLDIIELSIIRNIGYTSLVQELSIELYKGLIRLYIQEIIYILGFLLLEQLLKESSQGCNYLVWGSKLVRVARIISSL